MQAPAPVTPAAAPVPVWDPPPLAKSKQSWRERLLGLGGAKKDPSATDAAASAASLATKAGPSSPAASSDGSLKAKNEAPTSPYAKPAEGKSAPGQGAPAQNRPSQKAPAQNGPQQNGPAQNKTGQPTPVRKPVPGPGSKTGPSVPAPSGSPAAAGAPILAPVALAGAGAPATTDGPITQPIPVVESLPTGSATAVAAAGAKSKVGAARRTRKARLRLSRLDPWSVMKTSFLFSIAAGIMLVVAVYAVWTVLSTSQLFESVNEIVKSVVSTPGDTTPFRIQEYINTQKVMGVAALIACVDVVIFTALATLGSFLYNLAATMLGGLEVTLAED